MTAPEAQPAPGRRLGLVAEAMTVDEFNAAGRERGRAGRPVIEG